MAINIVLFCPEIPQNTGNIGRLCVGAGASLHLVKPLGFDISEKAVKRAGLDYWEHLELTVHDSVKDFFEYAGENVCYFFSTKTERSYLDCEFKKDAFLIFGNEGSGLPEEVYSKYNNCLYTIPMPGKYARSINLSNSVAIILYEALKFSNL